VLERPHDVEDRVDVADVSEKPVAQTLTLVRAAHQPGDVDELDLLGDAALDLEGVSDPVEPRVGDGHDRDVRVDRRERILGGLGARARERVEERRLARVRQPYDADLHRSAMSAPAGRPTMEPTSAPATASDG
jgi:hypothetical protein